ncbi:MAG: hypothetical protein ACYTAN_14755 [Planctomycetota bacterium]|jgi:hypothetical protein
MSKGKLCRPILALFLISLGGLLLHLRIHPVGSEASHWIPALSGIVTTFVLPFMFYTRGGAKWAYLITWLAVIIGTATMAWHSIEHWQWEVTVRDILLYSTIADIAILWAKIPLAGMILQWWKHHPEEAEKPVEQPAEAA